MVKNNNIESNKQIIIYKADDGKTALEVRLEEDSIWLNQYQLSDLFLTDRTSILRHIKNIYQTGELYQKSTCAKFAQVQKEGNRILKRNILYYNLDVIISVGYRINSKRGTQFRIWATNVLKQHLVQGYTLNEKRLKEESKRIFELQKTINLLSKTAETLTLTSDEAQGIIKIISDYTHALDILDGYDYDNLKISNISGREKYKLSLSDAIYLVDSLRLKFGTSELFGKIRGTSFESSINTIYQSFNKKKLYPSIEEKAANLLYFLIKNHPFVDGNKRIAASIFIWYLAKNNLLYKPDGTKRIADNALVALCLLIAESKPSDRKIIVEVVVNLINKKNS
ncbi:MAG: virulence protein RhuM/Fic/DOC family protein [Ignavibacteria bacterium]|jgi:prophage maintenance system killer protein